MTPFRQLRAFFRNEKLDAEMSEEMRAHLELQTAENEKRGMSPTDARYAAQRAFGGVEQIKERARDQRSWTWLEQTCQDVGYAIRSLRKNRAFTLAALLTLTFGIGVTTAIFTFVDTILWRPLPYAEPQRLVIYPRGFNGLQLRTWQESQRILDRIETHRTDSRVLTGLGEASSVGVDAVSPGLFDLLGRRPALGRAFSADDAEAGNGSVAIVSDRFWRGVLGGDATAIGRRLVLNDQAYTVIGVMPRGFAFPRPNTSIWVPLERATTEARLKQRTEAIGRLRPGLGFAAARQAVHDLNQRLDEVQPQPGGWQVEIVQLDAMRANATPRKTMLLALGAVGFVLLITCANVANLLLTRGAVRQREFAVRSALGAGGGRLFRQVLAESLLLALAGALGGLLVALWVAKGLWLLAPEEMTFLTINEISFNARVLGFTTGIVGLVTVICGSLPAAGAARITGAAALAAGTRSMTGSRAQQRWQEALVIAQAALAFVLLAGAGLLIRGFVRLSTVDPGFEIRNLVALSIQLPSQRYPSASRRNFFEELRERVARVPGVTDAALANGLPPRFGLLTFGAEVEVEGRPPERWAASEIVPVNSVDGNYFRVLRIPLLRGRSFGPEDGAAGAPVVIINEPMARRLWPAGDPIGQRVRFDPKQSWLTVIGVAGDVKAMTLDDENGRFEYYRPILQDGFAANETVAVRTAADPQAVLPLLRKVVSDMDGHLPLARLMPVKDLMARTLDVSRFSLTLMALFAGAAIVLAAIGLYGVMSYAVVQRTPEIGIRMALGGTAGDILWFVARRGCVLTGAGLLIGIAAAAGLTRFLRSLLYEVSALDAATFAGMAVVLGVAGALACWLPARRAAKVNPMTALRAD